MVDSSQDESTGNREVYLPAKICEHYILVMIPVLYLIVTYLGSQQLPVIGLKALHQYRAHPSPQTDGEPC